MSQSAQKPAILFVDELQSTYNQVRTTVIRNVIIEAGYAACLVRSRKEAQVWLADGQFEVQVMIISRTLDEDGLNSVARFARQKGIDAPIYALCAPEEAVGPISAEWRAIGIKDWFSRPLEPERLKAVLIGSIKGFHSSLAVSKADGIKEGQELQQDDSKFVSIKSKGMMPNTVSYFDVYLRLGPNKYVKIVNAGDTPSMELLDKHVSRGVRLFYIRQEIQEAYIRYCEQVAAKILQSKDVDPDVKVTRTMTQGQEAFNLVRTRGVSAESMVHCGSFVLNVAKVVRDYDLVSDDSIARFLGKVSSYEHNTRIAAMSGVMAMQLKLDSERSAHIIGMAGLLHDVGLIHLGLDESLGEIEKWLDPEQRAVFEQHPKVGSDLLASLKRFDPTVIQAVSQHHIRRNGSGFPRKSNFTNIHICAEIIGICDEYDYLLRRREKDNTIDVESAMSLIFDGFSRQVVTAFQQAFLVNEKDRNGALIL